MLFIGFINLRHDKQGLSLLKVGKYFTKFGLALAITMIGLQVPAAQAQSSGLFGSREILSTNMKSFDKWSGVWRRQNLEKRRASSAEAGPVDPNNECRGRARIKCNRDAWNKFIESQRGNGQEATVDDPVLSHELLAAINLYINRTSYIVDPVNWGVPDYWSTPDEFFLRSGDCEDYAISKFITLKRLGVDTAHMRLVVVQDENLRAAHAVLAVELDGTFHILDNQVDSVLTHDKILHYRPVYSINESNWWLHQVKRFGR